jgi:hypothetical protein
VPLTLILLNDVETNKNIEFLFRLIFIPPLSFSWGVNVFGIEIGLVFWDVKMFS